MDVTSFVQNGGLIEVPNPNYNPRSKKNPQPRTILVPDVQKDDNPFVNAGVKAGMAQQSIDAKAVEKYNDYGLTWNPREDMDAMLADAQGMFTKIGNSLFQTVVSEAGIGTIKAFSDLFDSIYNIFSSGEQDYTNPITDTLEGWQKSIREDIAPVYIDPNIDIANGGLTSLSWYLSNLPSVMSSLTLLIPSKAVTFGTTKLLGFAGRKGIQFARNMEKANKATKLGEIGEAAETAEKTSRIAKLNAFMNGPSGKTAKNIIDYGLGGVTSRILENYQEARQTYEDGKPVYAEMLDRMTPEERADVIDNLKEKYGDEEINWDSDKDVASLVARKAADETFKFDMLNTVFDIYQMYGIGKATRAINGPSRAALNRLNKTNIKKAALSGEALAAAEQAAEKTGLRKFGQKVGDFFAGGRTAVLSELSEGVEEAINFIAQEEGFHYGKVLLNQEADTDFFSDRLTDYVKNPKLWDAAFWGVAGGLMFNHLAEYSNRTTQAFDKIKQARQLKKNQVSDSKNAIKIPSFREAFKDTELEVRKQNLESTYQKYKAIQTKLSEIQDGKDVYGITNNGKLETQTEKDAAKEMALREFRDELILDAMDSGNYDLVREFLSSNEVKQGFINSGTLTREQADRIQSEVLSRGEELRKNYNKHLRNVYNAVAGWGGRNGADLSEMPAEVFNIIARENMSRELAVEYYTARLARLAAENSVLENDCREELDKAMRENGVTDFKAIAGQVYIAQQLGIINAEIEDIKNKKQHTTASGQAMLRTLEMNKRILEEELERNSGIKIDGSNDVEAAVNILLQSQTASAVELLPFTGSEQHTYQVNQGNEKFLKLAEAVNRRDRKVLSALHPAMKAILDRNPITGEEGSDNFLDEVINLANVRDQKVRQLYDDKGNLKVLQNINAQLDANYKLASALEINRIFEANRISTTREQIQDRANNILNELIAGRATAIESAVHLYQQLAKRYGTDRLVDELNEYILNNKHTDLFDEFNEDEKSTFETYTTLLKLNRPEQDIILTDIGNALSLNDIYEYTKDQDVIEIIREQRRKREEAAAQKSSASQSSVSAGQQQGMNNNTSQASNQGREQENGQIDEETPLSDDEVGEGEIEIEGEETNEPTNEEQSPYSALTDEQLDDVIKVAQETLKDENITEDLAKSARADLDAATKEKEKRQANADASSSTGEQIDNQAKYQLDRSDIVGAVKSIIKSVKDSGEENVTREDIKNRVIAAVKAAYPDIDSDVIDELVDNAITIADNSYKRKGESIESALAKSVIKLSRIAINSKSEQAIKEATAILGKTFDDLLDIFNKHLSRGKIDGKYIIPLEALLRYARNITNNEFEAQEMYNTFTKIIAENPDKYTTIKGKPISQNRVIKTITDSISERRAENETNFGGRTFNIASIINSLSEEDKNKLEEALKNLKPGSKVFVKANYDNKKTMRHKDGMFIGGINFIILDDAGNQITIATAPTSMKLENGFGERADDWFYQFPYSQEGNRGREFPIQTFFKSLFTSSSDKAKEFRNILAKYEALTLEEANDAAIGGKLLLDAHSALEEVAKELGVNINNLIWRGTSTEESKKNRIKHLAKLDIYTQEKWYLDLEESNYDQDSLEDMNKSYIESINLWFNKLIESSDARTKIEERLEGTDGGVFDVGVSIDSVGKQVLVITKEKDALPATKAIADQHKGNIHLAAGSPVGSPNPSQVLVSKGESMSLGGVATAGRSVVVIDTPDGDRTYINAYPVQANNKIFANNVKLAAFKEALETKLEELLDAWYRNPKANGPALEAFLDELGHRSADTRKNGGYFFTGFTRTSLPKGNGFSLSYKVVNGEILPPDSREEGEVHYLTFYDSVTLSHSKVNNGKTKARAAVQDYVRGREKNTTVVWNSNPRDTSTKVAFNNMKALVKKVVIDSLKVRIDPLNINADNNSSIDYGSFLTRDADGNIALKVTGVKKPGAKAKQYAQDNGDIVITGLGRDGNGGSFSDFVIFNDLVNLTTRPINGSNFSVFDHSDGDYGLTYSVASNATSTPIEEVIEKSKPVLLSNTIKDIIDNVKVKNKSKAIVNELLKRIADTDSALYNLTKNSTIIKQLLHKNVIFVENLNGGIYVANGESTPIPEDAYAAYIPDNAELKIGDKTIKVEKGQIVVGTKFMELLDGDAADIIDALHHILHENVHAFIADNDSANPELNERYKKELNDLWDEYTRKRPNSVHAKSEDYGDLEEFIVESLTNIDLMRDLNSIKADNPLSNPKRPKSLLGKLFDKLINWLSDLLGKDFKFDKESLFAKEYAIFEETSIEEKKESKKPRARQNSKKGKETSKEHSDKERITELTFDFEDSADNSQESNSKSDPEIENLKLNIPAKEEASAITDKVDVESDKRTSPPKRRRGPRASTISINQSITDEMADIKAKAIADGTFMKAPNGKPTNENNDINDNPMTFPTLRGGLDNVDGETYFDIQEKIDNGVISIKCN